MKGDPSYNIPIFSSKSPNITDLYIGSRGSIVQLIKEVFERKENESQNEFE
jgi:hypothetical protein